MTTVSLLDCTLRDGGHVNEFKFGKKNIDKIISGLSRAGLDIVEIGFLKNGEYQEEKTIFQNVEQAERFLESSSGNKAIYSLMIRPDWYDIEQLKASQKIKILRFAFYKEDLELAIKQAEIARELGYKVYMNPVNITGYTNADLNEVLSALESFSPDGVSIVDTFGSLAEAKFLPIYDAFDNALSSNIVIGLHLHENLALSFSLAQRFISLAQGRRNILVDSSVLGMGRIPGNLPTELMVQYMNGSFDGNYQISEVLALVDEPISQIKKSIPWGYSPEYAVSAFLGIHRSYPEYLVNTLNYSQTDATKMMNLIAEKGIGGKFSKQAVDELIEQFSKP